VKAASYTFVGSIAMAVAGCGFEKPTVRAAIDVDEVIPVDGASDVDPRTEIVVRLRGPVDIGRLPADAIVVRCNQSLVEGMQSIHYGTDERVGSWTAVAFQANEALPPGTCTVAATAAVIGESQEIAGGTLLSTFTVRTSRWTTPVTQDIVPAASGDAAWIMAYRRDEAVLLWSDPEAGLQARFFARQWGRNLQRVTELPVADGHLSVAIGEEQDGIAAWLEAVPEGGRRVLVSAFSAFWSNPQVVGQAASVTRVVAAAGIVQTRLVAWTQTEADATVVMATWTLGDNPWRPATPLFTAADVSALAATVNIHGALIVWTAPDGTDATPSRSIYAYQGAPGLSGVHPTVIATPGVAQVTDLQVVSHGATGDAIVAWQERDPTGHRIHAKRWRPSGGWTDTWTVSSATGSRWLRIGAEPGAGLVFWADQEGVSYARLADDGASPPVIVAPPMDTASVSISLGGGVLLTGAVTEQDAVAAVRRTPSGIWGGLELVAMSVPESRSLSSWLDSDDHAALTWIYQSDAGPVAAVSLLE
jgi:hypothetical protein